MRPWHLEGAVSMKLGKLMPRAFRMGLGGKAHHPAREPGRRAPSPLSQRQRGL